MALWTDAGKAKHQAMLRAKDAQLEPLKLEMAIKLADDYDSNGRRLTAVDELIRETIAGDTRLANLAAESGAAASDAWEAVARDLARQVINAETEIAELDEKLEEQYEEGIDAITGSRDLLANQVNDMASRLEDEEQAHCDTYVEAVRLSEELAGWQDSDATQYRKSTAAARLAEYRKHPTDTY